MKILFHSGRAWLTILACLYACKWLTQQFSIPIPAAILAMLLLFTLLTVGVLKERWLKPAAQPLLYWMGLFFVPAGVGVLDHLALLQTEGLGLITAATVSTLLIILITGHLYQFWESRQ